MRSLIPLLALIGSLANGSAGGTPDAASPPKGGFFWVDLFVDSGTTPLAAWQAEVRFVGEGILIAGIEGGESEVFREAPAYDPRALQGERAILAAYALEEGAALPVGRTRVARVHLMVPDGISPGVLGELEAAGDAAGKRIAAKLDWELRRR